MYTSEPGDVEYALARDAVQGMMGTGYVPSSRELVGMLGEAAYTDTVARLRSQLRTPLPPGGLPEWYRRPVWNELRQLLRGVVATGRQTIAWDREGLLFQAPNVFRAFQGDRFVTLLDHLLQWAHDPAAQPWYARIDAALVEAAVQEVALRDALAWSVPGQDLLPYTRLATLLPNKSPTQHAPYLLDLGNRALTRVRMVLEQLAPENPGVAGAVRELVEALEAASVTANGVASRMRQRDTQTCHGDTADGGGRTCEPYCGPGPPPPPPGRGLLLPTHLARGWWHPRHPRLRLAGGTCADTDSCGRQLGVVARQLFRVELGRLNHTHPLLATATAGCSGGRHGGERPSAG
jgi:hypothetical protein